MPEKTRRGAIPHPTRTPTRTKTRHEKMVMAQDAAKLKRQRLGVGGIVLAERNLQVAISDFDAVQYVPTTTAIVH